MKKGTINFWNERKNYGVVTTGKSNTYLKRYQITNPPAPAELSSGLEVEYDKEIKGFDIKSTCDLKFKVKE